MSGNLGANLINQLQSTPAAQPGYWGQQMANMNALQDYNAKQATADAYRQATDPNTGQVDPAKFNALIAGGPGAWNAGPAMMQQGQAQGAQGQGMQEQTAGQLAQMKLMSGEMSDLLQSGQPVTADQIHARLNAIGKEGWVSPGFMNRVNDDLNSQPPGADLTQWLRNHYATNLQASDMLKNVTSQPQTVDQGDRKIVVEGNPNMPGGQRVGTSYVQGQAPPPLGTTVMIHMSDGTDKQVTPDQVPGVLGGNPGSFVVSPGGAGGGGPDPLAALPKAQALAGVVQRESGGQNVNTRILGPDGKPASSASGVYQMVDGTWQEGAALAGIKNPPPRAIMASRADQDAAASALYDKYGLQPWARSAPGAARAAATPPANTPPATPPADTTTSALPLPPTPVPPPPGSPFGATAFSQPSTALPAPPSQATAPNTTAAVPAVPTPQMAAAVALARKTGRPAPVAGTDGFFANPDGSVGSGPRAGGLGRRADVGNALLAGVQTAQTTMPPATALTAGPGAPTTGLPSGSAPTVPPATAFGTGAFGSSAAAPPAPAPTAPVVAPQPAAQPTAPVAGRTPPPGYVSGIEARQRADIDAYTKDSGAVSAHQNNVNTLQNAYHALQLANTGPGTQNVQAAQAFLQSFGIATTATGDQATQWAEAHKYLMDFARTQGGLGGTDLQAQLAQGSNASTDIPKPAALAVVRNNIAKERMAMAQVQEANGSGGYVEHTKNFAPSQDLRAYQADIMPPQELKQIEALQKTNPQAFAKFQKSLDIARAHGLISDEDLAAQNQRIRALGP